MIRTSCPVCWRRWEFAESFAGQITKCANCGESFPVPASRRAAASPEETSTSAVGVMLASTPNTISTPPSLELSQSIQDAPRRIQASSPLPDAHSPGNEGKSDEPLPEWALTKTRACFRLGLKLPEIEQRLIDAGLTPAMANAVVMNVLDSNIQRMGAPHREASWRQPLNLTLSLVACGVCFVLAYSFAGGESVAKTLLLLLGPMTCIWFPGLVTRSSEPEWQASARWVGWILLILVGACRLWMLSFIPS
jgi:hypothetical protein